MVLSKGKGARGMRGGGEWRGMRISVLMSTVKKGKKPSHTHTHTRLKRDEDFVKEKNTFS